MKNFFFSSLLIVYEGSNEQPVTSEESFYSKVLKACCDDDFTPENLREVHYCYDADTSNSSDFNSAQEDVSQDALHRSFGEAAARGANSSTFFPISEETVFLNSSPSSSITPSSPIDSWMLYSNNSSSGEYTLPDQSNSSSSSNEENSESEMPTPKRNCKMQFVKELVEEEEEILTVPKRIFVEECAHSPCSDLASDVDVRIIDFAHTTFARNSDLVSKTVHQGPDGGFLTGLDSLQRLLSQIVDAEN